MAVALLVAAGSGERLGAGRPKAFVVLAGRPMLEWSLAAIRAAGIEHIVVAVPPDGVRPLESTSLKGSDPPIVVRGGAGGLGARGLGDRGPPGARPGEGGGAGPPRHRHARPHAPVGDPDAPGV